jgi:hypothetical protein
LNHEVHEEREEAVQIPRLKQQNSNEPQAPNLKPVWTLAIGH